MPTHFTHPPLHAVCQPDHERTTQYTDSVEAGEILLLPPQTWASDRQGMLYQRLTGYKELLDRTFVLHLCHAYSLMHYTNCMHCTVQNACSVQPPMRHLQNVLEISIIPNDNTEVVLVMPLLAKVLLPHSNLVTRFAKLY